MMASAPSPNSRHPTQLKSESRPPDEGMNLRFFHTTILAQRMPGWFLIDRNALHERNPQGTSKVRRCTPFDDIAVRLRRLHRMTYDSVWAEIWVSSIVDEEHYPRVVS